MNLAPPWSGRKKCRVGCVVAGVDLVLAPVAVQLGLMAQAPAPVIEKVNPDSGAGVIGSPLPYPRP